MCGLSRNFLNFKAYPYLYVQSTMMTISLIKLSLALKCQLQNCIKKPQQNNVVTYSLIICTIFSGNRKLSTIYALDSTKHLVAEAKASVR